MPAIMAHCLMGEASAKLFTNKTAAGCASRHKHVFNLGAQGPDIMFFALGHKELNSLGGQMHRGGINRFFAECLSRVRKMAAHEGRDEITAYMAGFLCHYALDTCAHPYIYYKTGFDGEGGGISGESAERHHSLETAIDCILALELEGKAPYEMNIAERISISSKDRALVAKFLSEAVAASYGVFIYPENYAKAMTGMASVYRALRDRRGRKRALARALGRVFGGAAQVAALMHYSPVGPLDYLNGGRATWHYPWDNTMAVNLSFMELFEKAVGDARIYVSAFMNAVEKRLGDRAALSILGGKNFTTGLESDVKFMYYNIGFEKWKEE